MGVETCGEALAGFGQSDCIGTGGFGPCLEDWHLSLEVGRLDGDQLRLPAKIVAFPHFDPKKERVKGNYEGVRGG